MSDNDSDLEAELAAITAGGAPKRPVRKPKVAPAVDIDKLVASSLKDIGTDEELSGDDDDPDLLGELEEITGGGVADEDVDATPAPPADSITVVLPTTSLNTIDVIKQRIEMYAVAEANAKTAGDSSKARRFNRGLKTLKDLLKQAEKGKTIPPDDIPPEVNVSIKTPDLVSGEPEEISSETPSLPPPVPTRSAPAAPVTPLSLPNFPPPVLPTSDEPEDSRLTLLKTRKNEFKQAALDAKKRDDKVTALKFLKIIKQFDTVIEALNSGQEINLANMPSLSDFEKKSVPTSPTPAKEETEVQNSGDTQPVPTTVVEEAAPIEEGEPEQLITAGTVLEALEQHMSKYKSVEQAAKDEGNSSKARRIGRIIKQYEQAIKLHKAGKPFVVEELPTPPGYAPIPVPGAPKPAPVQQPSQPKPQPSPQPQRSAPDKPTQPSSSKPEKEQTRISGNAKNTTLMDKQINFIESRMKEFRHAAVEAKKSGEVEEAKEYLRIFKGLEKLLDTAKGGFPVDLNTVPIPPSKRAALEDGFTFVSNDDVEEGGEVSDIRVRLEEQLAKQLMICKNTRDHNKAMGDVAGTNRFENLALSVQKDLDFVRLAHRKGLPIPKFHYEQKSFNIVKCNTDLSDNEIEINVVRGIGYIVANPKDVDTYVKVEFPWPQDEPYRTKTGVVKDTDSPEYNQKFSVEIQRNSKTFQRIFKRQQVKLEVYSKG